MEKERKKKCNQAIGTGKYVSCTAKAKAAYGLVESVERKNTTANLEYYNTLTHGGNGHKNVENTPMNIYSKSKSKI